MMIKSETCGVCCRTGKIGTERIMDQRDCPRCNSKGYLKVIERAPLTPKELKALGQQLGAPVVATCFVTR